jgi:hypothetical protein
MTKTKNWQCPHCSHDCPRRWNMVVHIRRWHRGIGHPIDKSDLNKNGHIFPADLPGQHIFMRHSPKPYKSNRIFANSPTESSGEGRDIIEETHKTVIEMEERRRKVEEIITIMQRYFNAPSWTPSVEQSSIFSKNVVQSPASFCQNKPEPMPPTLTRATCKNIREEVARQESTTQKISHESTSRNTKKWSIRTIYLVDSQGDVWSEVPPQNPTWVCKLNLFGDIRVAGSYALSPMIDHKIRVDV